MHNIIHYELEQRLLCHFEGLRIISITKSHFSDGVIGTHY